MLTLLANSDATPRTVWDAHDLADQCASHGIATDWWYLKANTVRMIAGQDSSEAYLILKGLDLFGQQNPPIAPLAKVGFYNHQIQFDGTRSDESPFVIKGWAFHSYRAINPSDDDPDKPTDPDTLYLVRFCDRRYFFAKQPCQIGITGSLVYALREGFNIVSMTVDDSAMSYDESTTTNFPYDTSTTAGPTTPYTWESLLEELWFVSGMTDDLGAVMGFVDTGLPSGGSYPTPGPIDIRPENRGTWGMFCDLLHCTGNEIFPNHDGTFRIQPIDDNWNVDTIDGPLQKYLPDMIDRGNSYPDWHKIPQYATMTFLSRYSSYFTDGGASFRNINSYETSDPVKVVDDSTGILTTTDLTGFSYDIEIGDNAVGDGDIVGSVEDFTTLGRSAVFGSTSAESTRVTQNSDFMRTVLRRYFKARLGSPTDITFPYFINSAPQPQWNEVLFYLARDPEGAPANRTHFLNNAPPSPGVKTLPMIPGGGNGSGGDRLVAADTTDDTPRELYGKIEDNTTYDAMTHQLVYAAVVNHGTDPTQDNKVRLFTVAGTPGTPGADGSPGSPGADGADGDTVTDGYAIDVTHVGTVATVAFQPHELHDYHTGQMQFYTHRQVGIDVTDRWMDALNYKETFGATLDLTGQILTNHDSGQLRFQDVFKEDDGAIQILANFTGGWTFKTTSGYVDSPISYTQLLGQIGGNWVWKTIEEWLILVAGYDHSVNQVLGHVAGAGTPSPQWITIGLADIPTPASLELNLDSSTLTSTLHTSDVTNVMTFTAGISGGSVGDLSDTVPVDNC